MTVGILLSGHYCRHLWQRSRRQALLVGSNAVSSQYRHFRASAVVATPKTEAEFQADGILDERGLLNFENLHEMQVRGCQVFEPRPLFGTYSPDTKQFEWMKFGEYGENVDRCRAVLKDLGIQAYDKVGIISNNRWEWAVIAAACYSLNANLVPMYEAQLPMDWTYILNDSSAKIVFCSTSEIYNTVHSQVMPYTSNCQASFCLDAELGEMHAFATIMAAAQPDTAGAFIQAPTSDDLANLIYTSGTTGKPKGVELTHMNFTSNIKAAARSMVSDPKDFIRATDKSLAFLPWAHSYGQTVELWTAVSHGSAVGISRGIPSILEDLQLVKPTMLFAVPTLYKRVYDGVNNMMESAPALRKKLMKTALDLGGRHAAASHGHGPPLGFLDRIKFKMLDGIVLKKIRDRFGGNMRHGFAGGAACPAAVLHFMDAIGIPICEGYGLTETSPIITVNVPEKRQIGSVGKPIGGVTVYIIDENGNEMAQGEEGEICCVGPNVMKGYYKNPEATREVISVAPDGKSRMFHTGDLGRLDSTGFVKITGRLKEQYKLENGKYVVPTPIEEAISLSRFINQVVLAGANKPYNVALLVPEWSAIRTAVGADDTMSDEELANDDRVIELIDHAIESHCAGLKKFEIPQKWAFVSPFTAANNMLTPKMSIRRHKVIETYAPIIAQMYGDEIATGAIGSPHEVKNHWEDPTSKIKAIE